MEWNQISVVYYHRWLFHRKIQSQLIGSKSADFFLRNRYKVEIILLKWNLTMVDTESLFTTNNLFAKDLVRGFVFFQQPKRTVLFQK